MLDRIRYFTGRYMTARDFSDADDYHRSMRHLHNRILHGWGIACGLDVAKHPHPECGLVIQCGLAIDCCGREIVVRSALTERIPWDRLPKVDNSTARDKRYVLALCLSYREVLTEKVPVLYSSDACASASYEDGRVRESYAIEWHAVKETELEAYGWESPATCDPANDTPPGNGPASGSCLEPDCPSHACVVLAVVRGDEHEYAVDTEHRRFIGHAPVQLTHICWISWPHGGFVKPSQIHEVSVRFDRPLTPSKSRERAGPSGINERTFVMQAGEQREDLDFVLFHKVPHLLPDLRTAVHDVTDPEQ